MLIVFEGGPFDGEIQEVADTHSGGKPYEGGFTFGRKCIDPSHPEGCGVYYQLSNRWKDSARVLVYVGDRRMPPDPEFLD